MPLPKLRRLFRVGFDSDVFNDYRKEIDAANLNNLKNLSLVGIIIGGAMVICSRFPLFALGSLLPGYILLTLACCATYLLSITILPKRPQLSRLIWHGLLVLVYMASAMISSILQPTTSAVTMIVLVVALPLFIIEYPPVIYAITGVMSILFILLTLSCKETSLVRTDLINLSVFYLLGTITYYQMARAKMRDIVSRSKLYQQRDRDSLTDLRNRRSCEAEINRCIDSGIDSALFIMFDIDNFKSINDQNGHDVGDRALKAVTALLYRHFRMYDIIGRLGGDEFIVFLPSCECSAPMRKKLSSLISDVHAAKIDDANKIHLGISAGVSCYPTDGATFQELYKHADTALYIAKQNGKAQFSVFGENAQ